jgi:hypothetical protein
VPLRQFTGKHEYVFAARPLRFGQSGPRQHLLKGYAFSGVRRKMDRQTDQTCGVRQFPDGFAVSRMIRLDSVGFILPRFDQNGASGSGSRRMTAARRITDIGALTVIAAPVGTHAAEDQEFLAKRVLMGEKLAGGRVADAPPCVE